MGLAGRPIPRPRITVYGMFGSFHVGGQAEAGGKVLVRYFSTVAAGQHSAAAGDSQGLLRELKPMRERVRVSDLRDLSSLLQRELDDDRVANELVPYLRGVNTAVGFFPGILVALVPQGFLRSQQGAAYPAPSPERGNGDSSAVDYGEFWTATRFKVGGDTVSLGQLEIDPNRTDLIVLDGQHRANAFRFATGTFDAVQSENSVYRAFYEHATPPDKFDSELPVTIVWFESPAGEPVEPRLISRKLFVDVNMNAKPVSASRNVLLDDRNRHSIVTGSIYRVLAQRAFDADKLSLLHTGFDLEEDQRHPLALMLPERLQYAMAYTAFAKDSYVAIEPGAKREWFAYQDYFGRLKPIAPEVDEADFRAAEKGDRAAFERTQTALDQHFAPKLIAILDGFGLVSTHVKATADLDAWVPSQAVAVQEAWDKVFRGGEGLYGGFARVEAAGAAAIFKKAIAEISDEFVKRREALLPSCEADQVRRAYDTFTSRAGLTALFMAAHNFLEKQPNGWNDLEVFVAALNKLGAENWVRVFADYKPSVVKELDPKLWPVVRAILLRVLQGLDPKLSFFDVRRAQPFNPDIRLVKNALEASVGGYIASLSPEEKATATLTDAQAKRWSEEAITLLKDTLARCGLKPLNSDQVLENYALQHMETMLPRAPELETEDEGDHPPTPEDET